MLQVHVSAIITQQYMERVYLIAECVRKYVPKKRQDAALEEMSMLLGALERQIVKDLVEWHIGEERRKYGIEAFNHVNGIEEESAAGRPSAAGSTEEVRTG